MTTNTGTKKDKTEISNALIHSVVEILVVVGFILAGNEVGTNYDGNILVFLFVFMGIGGWVHSIIDYNLAMLVMKPLSKSFSIPVFTKAKDLEK